jgi:response regulator of citrate/malate metabolism
MQLVGQVLADAGGDLSAAEAAELAGISRVSARRYLEHLTETGRAEVRLRYGEVGRPERRYAAR